VQYLALAGTFLGRPGRARLPLQAPRFDNMMYEIFRAQRHLKRTASKNVTQKYKNETGIKRRPN
jgi:hypothetical protein